MSDLFHHAVPSEFVTRVFETMAAANQHVFQVLTKRPERMAEWHGTHREFWGLPNVWLGTSVESRSYGLLRIPQLQRINAAIRFLSVEPLLEDLGEIDLAGIGWVIVGGESGRGARPMEESWVHGIRRQCAEAGVPFFFKQWGGIFKKRTGRTLLGRTWDAMPA